MNDFPAFAFRLHEALVRLAVDSSLSNAASRKQFAAPFIAELESAVAPMLVDQLGLRFNADHQVETMAGTSDRVVTIDEVLAMFKAIQDQTDVVATGGIASALQGQLKTAGPEN